MRTADEIALVDTVNRADLNAFAAADTLFVVDGREVVNYVNSILGTVLLTLTATDTAVCTSLACICALSVTRALDNNTRGVIDKVNNTVRTGANTNATAYTLSRVYARNAVINSDSELRTNLDTVAVAETGIGADLVARVCHIGGATVLFALVVILTAGYVAGAVAGNVSDLLNNVLCLNTESSGDTLCGRVATGYAKVGFIGLALCESLGIAVTAVVAAGAAVSAG